MSDIEERSVHETEKYVTLPKSACRESSSTFLEPFAYSHVWTRDPALAHSASKAQLESACWPVELLCRLVTIQVDRHSFLNRRCTSAVLECVCMNEFSRPVLDAGLGSNVIPASQVSSAVDLRPVI
jgi:hypothetical protein